MRLKIKKTICVLAIVILLAIVVRLFVGEPCYIPSASMEPAIMTGDWLWINKITYGGRLPERWADIPLINVFTHIAALRLADADNNWGYRRFSGFKKPAALDIIVFNSPENEESLLVKRVVGMLNKGDTFYLHNDNSDFSNMVYKEKEQYITMDENKSTDSIKCYILTQNHYYVIGDNYDNSRDSRFFGYVPEQLFIGKINNGIISVERTEDGNLKFRSNRFFFNVM